MELIVNIEKQLGCFLLKTDIEVSEEIVSLLGASGCGKSMTLKCIAGIEKPDRGRIVLNGRTLYDSEKKINLKPQERRVGYLFQQYALFPNMSVEKNIACAVRSHDGRKISADEKKRAIADVIEQMDLKGFEKSLPSRISGGQQQRVALARILVNKPDVMLLDEPFSALDSHLRLRMEKEVADIVRAYGHPTLFVSHSREEVFRLSDRIALMENGKISMIGDKYSVFRNPGTKNGAILTGMTNISEIKIIKDRNEPDAVRDPENNEPLNTVYAPDFGVELNIAGDLDGITGIAIPFNHIKFGKELDFMLHNNQARINTFSCDVEAVLENPSNNNVILRPEGSGQGSINIIVTRSSWRDMDHKKGYIHIFPAGVSLLK